MYSYINLQLSHYQGLNFGNFEKTVPPEFEHFHYLRALGLWYKGFTGSARKTFGPQADVHKAS